MPRLNISNPNFEYPDSNKVGVWTGDKAEDLMVERSNAVDYFHGERAD